MPDGPLIGDLSSPGLPGGEANRADKRVERSSWPSPLGATGLPVGAPLSDPKDPVTVQPPARWGVRALSRLHNPQSADINPTFRISRAAYFGITRDGKHASRARDRRQTHHDAVIFPVLDSRSISCAWPFPLSFFAYGTLSAYLCRRLLCNRVSAAIRSRALPESTAGKRSIAVRPSSSIAPGSAPASSSSFIIGTFRSRAA